MAKKEESTVTVAEENALSRYIRETRGELRKVTSVSYTHLDVYKRQI